MKVTLSKSILEEVLDSTLQWTGLGKAVTTHESSGRIVKIYNHSISDNVIVLSKGSSVAVYTVLLKSGVTCRFGCCKIDGTPDEYIFVVAK